MAVIKKLKEIGEDCLNLKRQGLLTEYGKGQLDLIEIMEDSKMSKEKYSLEDVKKLPKEARLVKVGLMIANELHSLASSFGTSQEKSRLELQGRL